LHSSPPQGGEVFCNVFDKVRRYKRWSTAKIREELTKLARRGIRLDCGSLAMMAPAMLAAIYRRGQGLVAERAAIRLHIDM
jgi:hypothetical protein